MKQHEYMVRCDKDVFEESKTTHYIIEVSTNNHSCYQEIKDAITQIITEYETKEATPDGD